MTTIHSGETMIDMRGCAMKKNIYRHVKLFAGRNLIWVSEIHVLTLVNYYTIYNVTFFVSDSQMGDDF